MIIPMINFNIKKSFIILLSLLTLASCSAKVSENGEMLTLDGSEYYLSYLGIPFATSGLNLCASAPCKDHEDCEIDIYIPGDSDSKDIVFTIHSNRRLLDNQFNTYSKGKPDLISFYTTDKIKSVSFISAEEKNNLLLQDGMTMLECIEKNKLDVDPKKFFDGIFNYEYTNDITYSDCENIGDLAVYFEDLDSVCFSTVLLYNSEEDVYVIPVHFDKLRSYYVSGSYFDGIDEIRSIKN